MNNLVSPSTNYTDSEWQDTVTRLAKVLALELPKPSDAASANIRVGLRDQPIKFASAGVNLSHAVDKGLPFWAVEPLIQQTATLLDRASETDQRHFDLKVQQFNVCQEVSQFFALDEVHKNEIQAHLYDLPGLEAKADLSVIINQRQSKTDLDARYAQLMSMMSEATFSELKKIAYDLAVNNADLSAKSYEPGASQLNGPGAAKRDYLAGAAVDQVQKTFPAQQAQRYIEERQYRLQMANADARIDSAQTKSDYYTKDSAFKRLRREIAVTFMQAKYSAISKGGALDYVSRLANLEDRQQSDVSQAFARMVAIDLGIKRVYGTSVAGFPSQETFSLQGAITWLRKASDLVNRFALTDQSYVMRISLLEELKTDLLNGIDQGWSFILPKIRFNKQCLIRLRGIAVYVVDEKGESFYGLDVTAPTDTATVWYPGATSGTQLDQTAVPVCCVRGAGSRSIPKPPEVLGTPSLHNISPLGKWNIQMLGQSVQVARSMKLRDIQLDLYIAAQNNEV
jgi:hypothetical protein